MWREKGNGGNSLELEKIIIKEQHHKLLRKYESHSQGSKSYRAQMKVMVVVIIIIMMMKR